ncbi:hypothetical protein [Rothia sp. HMSC065C03]|nr:hypothetical protein [Rothia sp. HMSC065C03]
MEDYVRFSLENLIRGGVCFLQVLGFPVLLKLTYVFFDLLGVQGLTLV